MRPSKYKIPVISLTVVLAAILAFGGVAQCAAKKPATTKPAAKSSAPSGPKVLTVVAGQPFETVPSSGSSKLLVTLCAEETAPATFSVSYGKSIPGVGVVEATDLIGPSRIVRANVMIRRVDGDNLIGSAYTPDAPVGAVADLSPTPVQFWVDVTVPKDTKPGTYKGSISFTSQNKTIDSLPIEVNIRPMRLVGSSKQYILCPKTDQESSEAFTRFLMEFDKIGFRSVAIDSDPASVTAALNARVSAGLTGQTPLVYYAGKPDVPTMEDVKAIENAKVASGMQRLLYFCVANPIGEDQVRAALDQINIFHRNRVTAVATVYDDNSLQPLLPLLDGVNYHISMPYVQALINGGTNRTNKWEWYWWDARKSVWDNRINSGIALWRSGLYGCMPMWELSDGADPAQSASSMFSEALREGINDTRYITTYMKALRELKDKKREKDKDYIAATETYLAGFMSKPLDQVTPADLRAFRSKMAEYNMKLTAMAL